MPFVAKIPRSVAPPSMGCQSRSSMVRRLKRAMVLEDRISEKFEMDIQVSLSKDRVLLLYRHAVANTLLPSCE